jgi:hypothetical protein
MKVILVGTFDEWMTIETLGSLLTEQGHEVLAIQTTELNDTLKKVESVVTPRNKLIDKGA